MEGPIYDKTIEFSVNLISFFKELEKSKEYIISKQLLRSGTIIGANVHEAASAQSRKDFINKMSIALKEAKESRYWLIVLSKSEMTKIDTSDLLQDNEEIIKIISKIIITAKHNLTIQKSH